LARVYVDAFTGNHGREAHLVTFEATEAEVAELAHLTGPDRIALAVARAGAGRQSWPGDADGAVCRYCHQAIEQDTAREPPWIHVATGDGYCETGRGLRAEPA
jgi:hypothetical protein